MCIKKTRMYSKHCAVRTYVCIITHIFIACVDMFADVKLCSFK